MIKTLEEGMRRWDSLLDNYLRQKELQGICGGSLATNKRELERWGCWLKTRRPKPNLEEIIPEQIIDYIRSRTAFRARSSVYGTISIMRGFGDYLTREGLWLKNALKWIQGPKIDHRMQIPTRIGREHMKKIWEVAATLENPYQRSLHLVVLSLLYGTGLRKGELMRLKTSSWDRTNMLLKIDGRKTGMEREVPLPEFTWKCLETYLPIRHNLLVRKGYETQMALLVGCRGRPLDSLTLWKMIRGLAEKAGTPVTTLHQFRHTCASDLLEEGIGLPQIQNLLGHATIYTTFRYIQIASPEIVKAIAMHPINRMLPGNDPVEAVHA
jgi:site-specific recombinase XerD